MNTGKWIILGSTVALVLSIAVCPVRAKRKARTPPRPKPQHVIIRDQTNKYLRGWGTREADKISFTDIDGKTYLFEANEVTVFQIAELNKQFYSYVRDVKNKEGNRTGEYVRLLPLAMNQQLYEQVDKLADKLIQKNPGNPRREVVHAKKWAMERLRQLEKALNPPIGLSNEDVQKMRFALIPIAPPMKKLKVTFKKGLRERFFAQMVDAEVFDPTEARTFRRTSPAQTLQLIKQYTQNQYQPDILIHQDPPMAKEFKRFVMPIISRSCATKACHGGDAKPKLYASTRTPGQLYANLLTAHSYPAKTGWIIDHLNPEASLIANYTLPADQVPTGLAHEPEIKPAFKNVKNPRYKRLIKWLRALPAEPPEYGIKLPGESKTKTPTASQLGKKQPTLRY